jgi:hypothetical protein
MRGERVFRVVEAAEAAAASTAALFGGHATVGAEGPKKIYCDWKTICAIFFQTPRHDYYSTWFNLSDNFFISEKKLGVI